MGFIIALLLTYLFCTVYGSVALIQAGGPLNTLVGILLIICYMVMCAGMIILGILDLSEKKKDREAMKTLIEGLEKMKDK